MICVSDEGLEDNAAVPVKRFSGELVSWTSTTQRLRIGVIATPPFPKEMVAHLFVKPARKELKMRDKVITDYFEVISDDTETYWDISGGLGFFVTWDGALFVTTKDCAPTRSCVARRGAVEVLLRREFVDPKTGIAFLRPHEITQDVYRQIRCVKFDTLRATSKDCSRDALKSLLVSFETRTLSTQWKRKQKREKAALMEAMLRPVPPEERHIAHPQLGELEITEHAAWRITEHLMVLKQVQPPEALEAEAFLYWKIRTGLSFLVYQLRKSRRRQRRNRVTQILKHKEEAFYYVSPDLVVLVITRLGDERHQLRTAYLKTKEEIQSLYTKGGRND